MGLLAVILQLCGLAGVAVAIVALAGPAWAVLYVSILAVVIGYGLERE